MWDTERDKKEKALLVVIKRLEGSPWKTEDLSNELKQLCSSGGAVTIDIFVVYLAKPTAAYFIGKGKAQEIAGHAQELEADVVIFSEELSSTQQRNLETIIKIKVLDRTQLILDIFAQRAKSAEGKIQVELAQLEYLLPRLIGQGLILSRLGGGIGTRGPGENKLEVDRRRIRERILRLKQQLKTLGKRRASVRENRRRHAFATVAIVGYTNAGKTTLLNRLTRAEESVKNILFCTLDSVARRYTLPNKQKVLFSDTVGFVQNLPHHLIEAFKATLEQVREADVLVHVLDASSNLIYEQSKAVDNVLRELFADNKPVITALNKADLVQDKFLLEEYLHKFENSVTISALTGAGIDRFLEKISRQLIGLAAEIDLVIPQDKMRILNLIYNQGQVLKKDYRQGKFYVRARVSPSLKAKIKSMF